MLESIPVSCVVGTILGFLAGLGVGGGSLLLLWLTVVLQMDPNAAQSINLLFFLPAAAVSIFFRRHKGNNNIKKISPAIISGCMGAALFSWLGIYLPVYVMKKAFGILLIITGFRELCYRPRKAR